MNTGGLLRGYNFITSVLDSINKITKKHDAENEENLLLDFFLSPVSIVTITNFIILHLVYALG